MLVLQVSPRTGTGVPHTQRQPRPFSSYLCHLSGAVFTTRKMWETLGMFFTYSTGQWLLYHFLPIPHNFSFHFLGARNERRLDLIKTQLKRNKKPFKGETNEITGREEFLHISDSLRRNQSHPHMTPHRDPRHVPPNGQQEGDNVTKMYFLPPPPTAPSPHTQPRVSNKEVSVMGFMR